MFAKCLLMLISLFCVIISIHGIRDAKNHLNELQDELKRRIISKATIRSLTDNSIVISMHSDYRLIEKSLPRFLSTILENNGFNPKDKYYITTDYCEDDFVRNRISVRFIRKYKPTGTIMPSGGNLSTRSK